DAARRRSPPTEVGDTGDGSVAEAPRTATVTWVSATTRRAWSSTVATESPGRRRKLTTARAVEGKTLSLTPAWKIVGAVVVRSIASPLGVAPKLPLITGPNSHWLARARRRE